MDIGDKPWAFFFHCIRGDVRHCGRVCELRDCALDVVVNGHLVLGLLGSWML